MLIGSIFSKWLSHKCSVLLHKLRPFARLDEWFRICSLRRQEIGNLNPLPPTLSPSLRPTHLFWMLEKERDRRRERIFHLLVHSPDGCNGLVWVSLSQEPGASFMLPYTWQMSQYLYYFPEAVSRELKNWTNSFFFGICCFAPPSSVPQWPSKNFYTIWRTMDIRIFNLQTLGNKSLFFIYYTAAGILL